jgi:hypothetical protein
MNVFGAFTFGSLIKTFIPGLVWLLALWLFWRGCAAIVPVFPPPPLLPPEQYQNALIATIPLALLAGLLSNIVVFMGVNDVLVRRPVRRRRQNRDLFALQDCIAGRVRADYRDQLGLTDPAMTAAFAEHADAEVLLLETIGVDTIGYVREQYWYHMEFQVNLLLAIGIALIGLLVVLVPELSGPARQPSAEWAGFDTIVLGGLCWFLLRAARKNFLRHVTKMTSLMAAALCVEPAGRAGAAPPETS